MNTISTIILLIALSICNGKPMSKRKCVEDTIDFPSKAENSSFVVFGRVMEIDFNRNNRLVFRVEFEVDCILKGSIIPRYINITGAGIVENRTNCQVFPTNQDIIVFLEQESSNDSTVFIPTDFTEVPYDEKSMGDILENTCSLQQLVPTELSSPASDVCPIVSTNPLCIRTTTKAMDVNDGSGLSPTVIPGGSQSNIDDIRSKSGSVTGQADKKGNANSLNMSILLTFFAMCFVKLL